MAHFAKIEDDIVTRVIVVKDKDAPTEEAGVSFIESIGLDGEWLQTSYNNNFRGTYAGIGMSYDREQDIFYIPVVEEVTADQ